MGRLGIDFDQMSTEIEERKRVLSRGTHTLSGNANGDMEKEQKKETLDNGEQSAETAPVRKKLLLGVAGQLARKEVVTAPDRGVGANAEDKKPDTARRATFYEKYRRMTTYIEVDTYDRLQGLYSTGRVERITHLVKAAVKEYLDRNYGACRG